uniref:mobilization protein C n=1 Tax=Brucella pseudintermedia TaxID=370111 RepID=UPI00158DAB05|nr:mobilization protein C [Brucella pseudintermedia]
MARPRDEIIADLQDRERQIQARIKALQAKGASENRKKDTRRKILIGGAVLAKVKRGDWLYQQMVDLVNDVLTSDRDRALFDLPPRPSVKRQNGNEGGAF